LALSPGTRVGPYEVTAQIGAGGMGEVYRARDTKLNRDVALKILPEAFALDGDRIARFRREAQVLASLNHPNIAAIYGFEDSGNTHALVLELVEGPTLADRIAKGPIPLDEALPIAKQIAEALEAAHEQGIIHRDLKPANIKLRDDGTVKVLDFGLAKAMEPASAISPMLTASPTLTTPAQMTGVGMILGTAAYMSPEQAKGRPADKRSDVWAFGCVLYEMLTGKRAFEGEDVSDTLASVLKSEPDWNQLFASTSLSIRAVIKGCLDKDRKTRIRDISVVRFVLNGALSALVTTADGATSQTAGHRTVWWQAVAAFFALTTAVGFPTLYLWRSTIPQVTRFAVLPPENQSFVTGGGRAGTSVAVSPDGRKLAFTARAGVAARGEVASDQVGKVVLWIRPIDSLVAHPLSGTDGAAFPFWSTDSRFVGFFANGKLLKIDVNGGPPQTVCVCNGRGASWSRDGLIVLNNGQGPLYRVSSAGGEPTRLTKLTAAQTGHSFPSFLPDGRHVLFYGSAASAQDAGVYVTSLDDGESHRLVAAATGAVYDVTHGLLLFVREGTLLAQSFSARTMTLSGEPFPVAEQVESAVLPGLVAFSVSNTGTLAYGTGASNSTPLRLTWVDRQGKVVGVVGDDGNYRGVDLSPDGSHVATHRHDGDGGDVWVTDISRRTTSRFTFDAAQDNSSPIWSPDGKEIAFGSRRAGKWGIYRKSSNNAGNEEKLTESHLQILPMAWAPDGRSLAYWESNPTTNSDAWLLSLTADRKAVPLLNTRFNEGHPQVSPDGRWMSYESTETGRGEVFVRAFPTGTSKWQVTTGGGLFARWRGDGRELFYLSQASNGTMMAVDVKAVGTVFEAGTPRALFDSGYVNLAGGGNYHTYAVSHDGQRFLIPRPPSSAADLSSPIVVVTNWSEGMK
jgi:serine/threonine protein kinase/Tol biopolymer transport system component